LDRAPERPALAFAGDAGGYVWRTTAQVLRRAAGAGLRLREAGLKPGGACVVALPSGEDSAVATLGILLAGGLPLQAAPPSLQAAAASSLGEILSGVVARTGARVLVEEAPPAGAEGGAPGGLRRLSPAALAGEADPHGLIARMPRRDDTAALQLTSGTTGFPRICVWKQRAVLAALDGMAKAMELGPSDVCFNWTPLYHDMGLVNNFLLCLTAGVPLALMSPSEFVRAPAGWLRGLHQTKATVTWSPNFGFALAAQRASEQELDGVRLEGVRAFWNAAERIHLRTLEDFHARFAPYGVDWSALKTNFGCAENVGGATFSDVRGRLVFERLDPQKLQRGVAEPAADGAGVAAVGVGRPYPGLRIRILSPRGKPLPDGRVGEIALRTPSRMEGYLKDAPSTRRALRGGDLIPGDLGYLRGKELFWVGRSRERITLHGRKLDPSDFEAVLAGVKDLRPGCFAAFGVDDARRGTQRVVLVTEVRRPLRRPAEQIQSEIRRHAFAMLGIDLREVLLALPGTLAKTSSGKRRHRHFKRLYEEGALGPFLLTNETKPEVPG
jgi:acyl-CoA synthetase (AMP-forming)/AMP-acid ligase II